jgi:hypothetical protein
VIHVVGRGNAAAVAGDPPSGPPTSPQVYEYSVGLYGVSWTNGDVLAHTEIGKSAAALIEPTSREAIKNPGITSWDSGTETCQYWWVRHVRNGQYSAWVLADEPSGGCGGGGGL